MGASGCKPVRTSSGLDEEPESVESVSIGKGVRVHQLEGNNFLGRLEDAARMSYRGRGLWRRDSSNAGIQAGGGSAITGRGSATAAGASSSARSSCYSELSSSVWQQQQQQQQTPGSANSRLLRQHFLSTAPSSTGPAAGPPSSRSLDCGGPVDRHSGSSSPDAVEPADALIDASQMDLTTLLLQGFDPAAYEQRIADRRLAKFAGRRQQPRSILSSTTTSTAAACIAPDEAEIPG